MFVLLWRKNCWLRRSQNTRWKKHQTVFNYFSFICPFWSLTISKMFWKTLLINKNNTRFNIYKLFDVNGRSFILFIDTYSFWVTRNISNIIKKYKHLNSSNLISSYKNIVYTLSKSHLSMLLQNIFLRYWICKLFLSLEIIRIFFAMNL